MVPLLDSRQDGRTLSARGAVLGEQVKWSLPDSLDAPENCKHRYGGLRLDLDTVVERTREIPHELEADEYLENDLLPGQIAEFRSRTLIPFIEILNGDYICLDVVQETGAASVVYLDHEMGFSPFCAIRLGLSFTDFMPNWAEIGFVGPELWHLAPFLNADTGSLDARCANAVRWRTWLLE